MIATTTTTKTKNVSVENLLVRGKKYSLGQYVARIFLFLFFFVRFRGCLTITIEFILIYCGIDFTTNC